VHDRPSIRALLSEQLTLTRRYACDLSLEGEVIHVGGEVRQALMTYCEAEAPRAFPFVPLLPRGTNVRGYPSSARQGEGYGEGHERSVRID
jgi:hypothetical protein